MTIYKDQWSNLFGGSKFPNGHICVLHRFSIIFSLKGNKNLKVSIIQTTHTVMSAYALTRFLVNIESFYD